MRATAHVSAIEQAEQAILTESLRRAARVRPRMAMVMAEVLEADEGELHRFAASLTPEEPLFALNLVAEVIAETGGEA